MIHRLLLAAAVVAATVGLSACDDRECLNGHYITTMVPIVSGKVTTMMPQQTWVCDQYAPGPQ